MDGLSKIPKALILKCQTCKSTSRSLKSSRTLSAISWKGFLDGWTIQCITNVNLNRNFCIYSRQVTFTIPLDQKSHRFHRSKCRLIIGQFYFRFSISRLEILIVGNSFDILARYGLSDFNVGSYQRHLWLDKRIRGHYWPAETFVNDHVFMKTHEDDASDAWSSLKSTGWHRTRDISYMLELKWISRFIIEFELLDIWYFWDSLTSESSWVLC